MTSQDISKWPIRFLEDCELEEILLNQSVFVDNYVSEAIDKNLSELNEQDLQLVLNKISNFASFYSRLRVSAEHLLGELMISRMMDEADLEAEEEANKNGESQLIKIDNPEDQENLLFSEEE
jgi:hypothetical protein